jgi:hypothetical protein
MDNVEKHNICTNVPSSQTFKYGCCCNNILFMNISTDYHLKFIRGYWRNVQLKGLCLCRCFKVAVISKYCVQKQKETYNVSC